MKIIKVTEDEIHPELQGIAKNRMVKLYGFLFKSRLGFKIANWLRGSEQGQDIEGLDCSEIYIPSNNGGADIRTRIYKPNKAHKKLPVLLYLHGGGYAMGCPEMAHDFIAGYIKKRPCIVVSPDYRLSINHPFPAGFNDGYDTLLWIRDNEKILDSNGKIIVAGHSAGGGMTAAITLKARDTGDVKIAFQMPFYPMLDHTHSNDSSKLDAPFWSVHANIKAWKMYLAGALKQGADISPYASPILNTDYKNFPPTITFVGDIEPFYDETMHYVDALKKHKIPVEFKAYKGAYHAFDMPKLFGSLEISKDAFKFQMNAYAKFYDRYI